MVRSNTDEDTGKPGKRQSNHVTIMSKAFNDIKFFPTHQFPKLPQTGEQIKGSYKHSRALFKSIEIVNGKGRYILPFLMEPFFVIKEYRHHFVAVLMKPQRLIKQYLLCTACCHLGADK